MNSFPKANKIVYSTCSLFPQENERVISNVVKSSRAKWKVLNVKDLLKGHWNNFGSGMYGEIGTRCLYARPDSDLTTGFFLAVLERDPKKERVENEEFNNKVRIEKNNKQGKAEEEISNIVDYNDPKNKIDLSENEENYQKPKRENDEAEGFDKVKSKKKNKKKRNVEKVIEMDQLDTNKEENDIPEQHKTKKNKKHKKDVESASNIIYETDSKSQNKVSEEIKKSKKKNGAEKELSHATNIDSAMNNDGVSVTDKKKKEADIDQNDKCNIQDGVENLFKGEKPKKYKLKHQSVDAVYEDNCEPVKKKKKKRNKE